MGIESRGFRRRLDLKADVVTAAWASVRVCPPSDYSGSNSAGRQLPEPQVHSVANATT